MSILIIDIGTGTQDVLIYDPKELIERNLKMVLPSPTVIRAKNITKAKKERRPIFLEGYCMGGGPIVRAIRDHIQSGLNVYSTIESAKTIHDNLEHVMAIGVHIVDKPLENDAVPIFTSDYMWNELKTTFERFSIPYPEHCAFAVQDHGFSPEESNRINRFKLLQSQLEDGGWNIYSLATDPPRPEMTRMWALLHQVPGSFVIDTGPAALLGMLCDSWVKEHVEKGITIVNAGNSHTLCCTLKGDVIHGLFEHHTFALTRTKLDEYLTKLREGTLTNEQIFNEGGHGAVIHEPLSSSLTAVTGPNRRLLLPLAYQAAPFGDMMLTGCFGILRVWKRNRTEI